MTELEQLVQQMNDLVRDVHEIRKLVEQLVK